MSIDFAVGGAPTGPTPPAFGHIVERRSTRPSEPDPGKAKTTTAELYAALVKISDRNQRTPPPNGSGALFDRPA